MNLEGSMQSKPTFEQKHKFNHIMREVVSYVYYDATPEEQDLILLHVKSKNIKEIKNCQTMITDDLNEFFARKIFMEIMLESRFIEKCQEFIES